MLSGSVQQSVASVDVFVAEERRTIGKKQSNSSDALVGIEEDATGTRTRNGDGE